ncbi:MAG: DNA/RNA helicase domain-containing protein [Thiolinea sp.]
MSLSGNGPLVAVLQEALAQDNNKRNRVKMGDARRKAKAAIQNIHHFRDDSLKNSEAPVENVVIFDEAQRAWDLSATRRFMESKRQQSSWDQSEPEFLISVMDRHPKWCVIIALIGGGQEINRGEAGLQGWVDALEKSFNDWKIFYSAELRQPEYAGSIDNLSFLTHSSQARSLKTYTYLHR